MGVCVLDEISFSGGPLTATFGALAIPASESFKTLARTKTWKNVTIKKIGSDIAKRYKLGYMYDAGAITIKSLEQSQEPDCSFLLSLCDTYGLSLKIYNNKLVIYDMAKDEKKKSTLKLTRASFIDDQWEYKDAIEGTYTGVRVTYKQATGNKKKKNEISVFLGLKAEKASGSRVLRINETCESQADAYRKGAAQVNKANRQATTFSGTILANQKIFAGRVVTLSGFGKADGKYFIDTCTTTVSDGGSTQDIEMHRVQTALSSSPKKKTNSKKKSSSSSSATKTYTVNTRVSNLNLRSSPNGSIMTSMPKGTKITSDGKKQGDWVHVKYGDTWGWAYAGYLA